MSETPNQLAIVVNEAGLAEQKSEQLLKSFVGFFAEAKEITAQAKDIIVTDETQKPMMERARKLRLQLRDIRTKGVEATRVQLKEQALREGKAIDGLANVIKALIIPVEEHLEKQEKFAELREAERIQKRYEERVDRLMKYGADPSLYQLRDMADASFEKLIEGMEQAKKSQEEAERKAEEERVALEKKREAFRKRQIEVAPYRDFMEEEITEDMDDATYVKLLDSAIKAKKKHDAEQEQIRKDNEKLRIQAEKDRKAKEAAELKLKQERELQEKKQLEEKQRIADQKRLEEEAAAKAKAEEEERQRQKLLAPDKQKLLDLAKTIEDIQLPAVNSKEANAVLRATEDMLGKVQNYIREKAKAL